MSQITLYDTRPGVLGLPRRRSRARAFFNLIILPLLASAGLFWLAGVRP